MGCCCAVVSLIWDPGSIPRSGSSPGERNGNTLQYSCLENSMDGGAWWAGALQSMGSQRVRHDWESFHFLKLCLELFTLWWVMLFLVVMYKCESWIIKKAEGWRIDVFKIWCWKRFLKVPWTARSNQSILRETNPKYSLEELTLSWSSNIWPRYAKNKLIGKDCDAGKDWNQKEKGTAEDKMVGWHIDYMDINLSKLQ